jgi:hypothetical protein
VYLNSIYDVYDVYGVYDVYDVYDVYEDVNYFVQKGKLPGDLTYEDVFQLEAERYCAILVKIF